MPKAALVAAHPADLGDFWSALEMDAAGGVARDAWDAFIGDYSTREGPEGEVWLASVLFAIEESAERPDPAWSDLLLEADEVYAMVAALEGQGGTMSIRELASVASGTLGGDVLEELFEP